MTEKMIAYCGMVCSDCFAYIATQKNDDKMRKGVAEWLNDKYQQNTMRKEVAEWRTNEYKRDFNPEDINCDGCLAGGRSVGYCQVCTIKKCGKEKGVTNCGWCAAYPCSELDSMFKAAPATKETLDAVKKGIR
jgi:hypothetical protein